MDRAAPVVLLLALMVACGPGDAEAIRRKLDARIPEIVARGNSPSIQVAVVHGDRIIWSEAFGENAGTDRVYMNASVQKVFDTIAVMQLVERGLLDLDADVGTYVPFGLRHPDFPEVPVTVRMLLAHRSGLEAARYQFCWDTGAAFSPTYRPSCPTVQGMSLEEYLTESLTPGGSNYDPGAWVFEPGTGFRYSLVAYPFLSYLVEQVTGQSYPDYMRGHVFEPLQMRGSGFRSAEFAGRHAIPYTRIDGENVELPVWDGTGHMMHTTAEDMAQAIVALMNGGGFGEHRILAPETIALMLERTTRFKGLFRKGRDMHRTGRGLGLYLLRGGWVGHGGSSPGFQCLWRYNPSDRVGFVILSNVNAILGGGDNYQSARAEIYDVQDVLLSILD
jgi:CubicO group peptidase (beta-lactamase class C family)